MHNLVHSRFPARFEKKISMREDNPPHDHVKQVIELHSSSNFCSSFTLNNSLSFLFQNSNIHRCFFQLFTGVRFDSTLDLDTNVSFTKKLCKECGESSVCDFIQRDCFDTLTFKSSKTTPFQVILLPFVKNCFLFLQNLKQNNSGNRDAIFDSYTSFLKSKFSVTSHKVRKFVCNLNMDHRNTGNWTNQRVMNTFYLSKHQKFIELYFLYHKFSSS